MKRVTAQDEAGAQPCLSRYAGNWIGFCYGTGVKDNVSHQSLGKNSVEIGKAGALGERPGGVHGPGGGLKHR